MTTATVTPTWIDIRLLQAPVALPLSGPADPALARRPQSLEGHRLDFGVDWVPREELLTEVERAGLLGHGGAFVPVAFKWRDALTRTGRLTVVANGAESEPLAAKDGTLLRQRPHLVLDGLMATGAALGADRLVVWLHGDDQGARRVLERAVRDRPRLRDTPPVEIVSGPCHYLAGEASAVSQAVVGGPALPTVRRRLPAEAPRTLVHNVETLARIALVARRFPLPTTRLITLLAGGRRVVEVDRATTFGDLLRDARAPEPAALLLGGFAGIWVDWTRVRSLRVDETELRTHGLSLGAGVVVPIGPDECGVRHTADLIGYLASMSARQCGPCLFGLPALAAGWSRLAEGRGGGAGLDLLRSDAAAVSGRGACRNPDGAVRLMASALSTFAADVDRHAAGKPCRVVHRRLPGVAT